MLLKQGVGQQVAHSQQVYNAERAGDPARADEVAHLRSACLRRVCEDVVLLRMQVLRTTNVPFVSSAALDTVSPFHATLHSVLHSVLRFKQVSCRVLARSCI